MLGFRARALTSEIKVDGDEIEDAAWFSAAEIRTFGDWGDPGAWLQLPRRDSIARLLVNAWLAFNLDLNFWSPFEKWLFDSA